MKFQYIELLSDISLIIFYKFSLLCQHIRAQNNYVPVGLFDQTVFKCPL